MKNKPTVTLPGKVEKIIPSRVTQEPEKAQIAVEGADPLYDEIRIKNELTDENGSSVRLKEGADVEVTVETHKDGVTTHDTHGRTT